MTKLFNMPGTHFYSHDRTSREKKETCVSTNLLAGPRGPARRGGPAAPPCWRCDRLSSLAPGVPAFRAGMAHDAKPLSRPAGTCTVTIHTHAVCATRQSRAKVVVGVDSQTLKLKSAVSDLSPRPPLTSHSKSGGSTAPLTSVSGAVIFP